MECLHWSVSRGNANAFERIVEKMNAQTRDSNSNSSCGSSSSSSSSSACAGDNDGDAAEAEDFSPPQRKRAKTPPNQISPLLITHVLEQVFQGATISDLTNFRLVCREWNTVATKCLQSRLDFITIGCRNANHNHSLHYHSHEHLVNSISGAAAAAMSSHSGDLVSPTMNTEKLNGFLQVIAQSTNPPFTKYEIVSSFFIPQNQQILQKFFQVTSPYLQMLKISIDNRAPGDYSSGFLSHLTFPKLRSVIFEVLRRFSLAEPGSLELETVNQEEMKGNEVSYRILSAISFGATSLESLEVALQRKCDGEGERRYNQDGTPNFEGDRRAGLGDGGTCPCQHFNLPLNVNGNNSSPNSMINASSINSQSTSSRNFIMNSAVPSILKCHLPLPLVGGGSLQTTSPRLSNSPQLKKLHLRLRNSFIHQSCITSLLERLADTLEELSFSEEGHGSRVIVEFPRMKRLSKLTISSICEFEQNFVTILPFSYSEVLPRLTSLNLWDCFGTEKRYETLFLSTSNPSPSHTLSHLVFPSQFSNVQLAQNIPNVFPKLRSLTMVFSTRTDNLAVIETIFECCGESLEELHLITDMDIQNQNVDHVLTGLPKEICKKMRVEESFLLPLLIQGIPRKASLVNLKRLKRLIFQLEHKYSRAPLITDVTGYLAFMEMPSLEYLRFTRYGMSWNCLDALSKKVRIDALNPNGNNVFEIETFDFDFDVA